MTIDEVVRRILRGHWFAIALCVTLPVLFTVLLSTRSTTMWDGSVRVQVSADPSGSPDETGAMSARVLALATTPSLVAASLDDIGVTRNVTEVSEHHVTAQQLGVSSVVEVTVTDRDHAVAGRLAAALAHHVAGFINNGSRTHFSDVVSNLDDLITSADERRDTLAQTKQANGVSPDYALSLQIRALTQEIGDLRAVQSQLSVTDATRDRAIVIGAQAPEVTQAPSGLAARIALAVLLGLMLGLAVAAGLEVIRPKVGNARELARILDAPLVRRLPHGATTSPGPGSADGPDADADAGRPGGVDPVSAEVAEAMARMARRQGVDTVVLVPADERQVDTVQALVGSLPPAVPGRTPHVSHAEPHGRTEHRPAVLFDSDGNGISDFGTVRLAGLADLLPSDELAAGLVVVSTGAVPRRRLDHLDDVVRAGRWPVLGVLDATELTRMVRAASAKTPGAKA